MGDRPQSDGKVLAALTPLPECGSPELTNGRCGTATYSSCAEGQRQGNPGDLVAGLKETVSPRFGEQPCLKK